MMLTNGHLLWFFIDLNLQLTICSEVDFETSSAFSDCLFDQDFYLWKSNYEILLEKTVTGQ